MTRHPTRQKIVKKAKMQKQKTTYFSSAFRVCLICFVIFRNFATFTQVSLFLRIFAKKKDFNSIHLQCRSNSIYIHVKIRSILELLTTMDPTRMSNPISRTLGQKSCKFANDNDQNKTNPIQLAIDFK